MFPEMRTGIAILLTIPVLSTGYRWRTARTGVVSKIAMPGVFIDIWTAHELSRELYVIQFLQ